MEIIFVFLLESFRKFSHKTTDMLYQIAQFLVFSFSSLFLFLTRRDQSLIFEPWGGGGKMGFKRANVSWTFLKVTEGVPSQTGLGLSRVAPCGEGSRVACSQGLAGRPFPCRCPDPTGPD